MSWQPILEGEDAERARAVVDTVATDLLDPLSLDGSGEKEAEIGPSVSGGEAGRALFFAYLADDAGEAGEAYAEQAGHHLDRAIDALAAKPLRPALYSGFCGVAWTVEHLSGRLFEADEDATAEIAGALVKLLERPTWEGDYDLISGLAGFGVYALEALPQEAARRILELLTGHFERLAQPRPVGRSWFTEPHLLPGHQLAVCPNGYYNLGLAHGVPAVLEILSLSAAAGIEPATARALVEDGVAWLWSLEPPPDGESRFGTWMAEGIEPSSSRLAWCYGDLGMVVALYGTARAAGREDWAERALEVARDAAARPPESARVNDAGLCHGAAGNGHLFNRLYQATGEEAFLEAARLWLARALELRKDTKTAAGIYAYEAEVLGDSSTMAKKLDRTWLTGSVGVGMALLAATGDVEPEWDRLLMVDIS